MLSNVVSVVGHHATAAVSGVSGVGAITVLDANANAHGNDVLKLLVAVVSLIPTVINLFQRKAKKKAEKAGEDK